VIHLSSDTGDLFEQSYAFAQKQVRKLVEKHPASIRCIRRMVSGSWKVRPGPIGAMDSCPA
jgi:hypothetical protein